MTFQWTPNYHFGITNGIVCESEALSLLPAKLECADFM